MRRAFSREYLYDKRSMAFLQGAVDSIGYFIRRPSERILKKDAVRGILIARIDHLGDVFIASAILPHLKKTFPEARIDFLAGDWTHAYLKTNPLINGIIRYDAFKHNRRAGLAKRAIAGVLGYINAIRKLRAASYDLCINLRTYPFNASTLVYLGGCKYSMGFATGGFGFLLDTVIPYRERVHESAHLGDALAAIGVEARERDLTPRFTLSSEAGHKADETLESAGIAGGERFALFHTGAGTPVKYWRRPAWEETAKRLREECGLKVVAQDPVYGGINGCIALPALVSFDVYAAIARRAALFIGLDSFPAHLAASFGTPTVVIWCGVNDPVRWRPLGGRVAIVNKETDCSPCFKKRGCADMTCMEISAAECVGAAAGLLDKVKSIGMEGD
ncbi:MAG: glycosyltransferase family 9 protein [Deltaproteobacteria bacterium]|nr:glycosyltransferase family 9 protein [Deltaproteobacteria bacterium]